MRTLIAVIGLVVLMSGCSSEGSHAVHPTVIDPDASFYASTLQQWKDYGDAIVTLRVVSDRTDPKTSSDPNVNGGLYGRIASLRVTHIFWTRDARHRPPSTFSMAVFGWFGKGSAHRPIVARGEPRIESGHTYLATIARFREGWAQLTGGGIVPFDHGVVGKGEWLGRDGKVRQPAIDRLLGKNVAGVQQIVDSVTLSAASRRLSNVDPAVRARTLH